MSQVTIAIGKSWDETYVKAYLKKLNFSRKEIEFFRIESLFSSLMVEHEADAEWSIKYGEVVGEPECIQFDIDAIRDKAIEEYVDKFA
jgi:hypothetical protein